MKRGFFYSFIRIICIFISKIVFRCKINNKENLPKHGKVILCCNHLSFVDPIFLIASQKRKICFMGKDELFKKKLASWFFYKMGVFPVSRGKGDVKAIETAKNILKNDGVLGIFLEGTRSKTGELLKTKSGAAMIAYKMESEVIPVCITPKDAKKVKALKRNTLSFGKLISKEELGFEFGKSTEFRNASRKIMDKIREMRERDSLV